jgi:glycerophosphoryl diester phosphodiesterase
MRRANRETEIIAHRGASAYAAEHTVAAYDLALAQGAPTLEVDVRATADGELVVVHDPTLLRTAGDPRRVDGLTGTAIRRLDPAVRPLRLDAVLARYAARARFLIDLKEPTPDWEAGVIEAIDRHGLRDRVVVQSFDGDALRRLHGMAPWLAIARLYRRGAPVREDLDAAASFAIAIAPWHGQVDLGLLMDAEARGLSVQPWTVDGPAHIEGLLALGVHGLETNVPDVAHAVGRRIAALPQAA